MLSAAERRDGDTSPPAAERQVRATWEDTRCRSCARLLCKNTRDALRAGQMIEIKCGACNTTNYLVGRPEV